MVITGWLIPGLYVTNLFGALLTVVALAVINATVWDAALFFSVPYSLSVHAALLLFANGFIFLGACETLAWY